MTNAELVERVAERIWAAEYPSGVPWAKLTQGTKSTALKTAHAMEGK